MRCLKDSLKKERWCFLYETFHPELTELLKEASELLALFSTINRKSKL